MTTNNIWRGSTLKRPEWAYEREGERERRKQQQEKHRKRRTWRRTKERRRNSRRRERGSRREVKGKILRSCSLFPLFFPLRLRCQLLIIVTVTASSFTSSSLLLLTSFRLHSLSQFYTRPRTCQLLLLLEQDSNSSLELLPPFHHHLLSFSLLEQPVPSGTEVPLMMHDLLSRDTRWGGGWRRWRERKELEAERKHMRRERVQRRKERRGIT